MPSEMLPSVGTAIQLNPTDATAHPSSTTAAAVKDNQIPDDKSFSSMAQKDTQNLVSVPALASSATVVTPESEISKLTNECKKETLDLSGKILDEKSVKNLCDILANNKNIKVLVLWECEITDAMAQILATTTTLTSLSLRGNKISDAGAKALAANKTFLTLDVSMNQIGDLGAQALATNQTLTTLYADHNEIGDAGAEALTTNTTLTTLYIHHNKISKKLEDTLKAKIAENESRKKKEISTIANEMKSVALTSTLDRWTEILTAAEAAIAFNSKDAVAHTNKSSALGSLGRYNEALVAAEIAITLNPKEPVAHHNKSLALGGLDRYDEALAAAEVAITLNSKDAVAHRNKSLALCGLDRWAEALTAAETAIALNPKDDIAHDNKSTALSYLGRKKKETTNSAAAASALPDHKTAASTSHQQSPAAAASTATAAATTDQKFIPHVEKVLQTGDVVSAVVGLPDGRVASSAMDNSIKIWDVKTEQYISLKGHTRKITALIMLLDGRLASGSEDGTIKLWNLKSAQCESTLNLNYHRPSRFYTLAVLPNGQLASLSAEHKPELILWDVETVKENCKLEMIGATTMVALPNGRLAINSASKIMIWDTKAKPTDLLTREGHTKNISTLAVLSDGSLVSASSAEIKLWNLGNIVFDKCVATHKVTGICKIVPLQNKQFVCIQDQYESVKHSFGSTQVKSKDDNIKIWKWNTKNIEQSCSLRHGDVNSLTVLPNRQLVSSSNDGSIKLWDVTTAKLVKTLQKANDYIYAMTVLPNGKVAMGSHSGDINIWDMTTNKHVETLRGHSKQVYLFKILKNGHLISSSYDGTSKLWDLKTLQCVSSENWLMELIEELPDGRLAIVATVASNNQNDSYVNSRPAIISLGYFGGAYSQKPLVFGEDFDFYRWGHRGTISALAMLPDGRLASAGQWYEYPQTQTEPKSTVPLSLTRIPYELGGGIHPLINYEPVRPITCFGIKLWDVKTGEYVAKLPFVSRILSMTALPNANDQLVVHLEGERAYLWDLKTNKQIGNELSTDEVNALTLTPTNRLTSISLQRFQKLNKRWDSYSRQWVELNAHDSRVLAAVALPDGRVVSATADASIKVWVVNDPILQPAQSAEKLVTANSAAIVSPVAAVADNSLDEKNAREKIQTTFASAHVHQPLIPAVAVTNLNQTVTAVHDSKDAKVSVLPEYKTASSAAVTMHPHSPQPTPANIAAPLPISTPISNSAATAGMQPTISPELLTWMQDLKDGGFEIRSWQMFCQQMQKLVDDIKQHLNRVDNHLAVIDEKLETDPTAQAEQAYIDQHPKLLNYQRKLRQELGKFITAYSLASSNVFRLEDNKKGAILTALGNAPVIGSFLKIFTAGLQYANDKYRAYRINRLTKLFTDSNIIAHALLRFSRQLTLIKETEIQGQVTFTPSGVMEQLRSFYESIKEELYRFRHDQKVSDSTGLNFKAEEKLALLDGAFLIEQVLSGNAKLDAEVTKDLAVVPIFLQVVLKNPNYQYRTPAHIRNTSVSAAGELVSNVVVASAPSARAAPAVSASAASTSSTEPLSLKIELEAERLRRENLEKEIESMKKIQESEKSAREQEQKRIAQMEKAVKKLTEEKGVAVGGKQQQAYVNPEQSPRQKQLSQNMHYRLQVVEQGQQFLHVKVAQQGNLLSEQSDSHAQQKNKLKQLEKQQKKSTQSSCVIA